MMARSGSDTVGVRWQNLVVKRSSGGISMNQIKECPCGRLLVGAITCHSFGKLKRISEELQGNRVNNDN